MRNIIPQLLVICLLLSCSANAKELSRRDFKALGEQYIQAWETGDFEKVKALFLQPEKLSSSRFNECKDTVAEFDIDKVGDGYVVLEVELKENKYWRHYTDLNLAGPERWLLFTTDGKIKYDSILLKHPIEISLKSILIFYDYGGSRYEYSNGGSIGIGDGSKGKLTKKTFSSMKELGIPMYGLDLSGNPEEIDESLSKMTKWLLEEGDQWDSSEPKAFFPRDLLKKYKNSNKYHF